MRGETIMTVIDDALKKLNTESEAEIKDRYGQVIKTYVYNAVSGFCAQNEIFAKAVLEGGEFAECIKHCTQGIQNNSGISDIDIYRRAVQFYFPGATVDFKIAIVLNENEYQVIEEPQRVNSKTASKKDKPADKKKTGDKKAAVKQPKDKTLQKQSKKQPLQNHVIQLDLFSEEGGLC